ncbi:MAG: hypothetical protein KBC81_01100 [Candidatus Pacebacteria bacterium]|nr:hypothetical protein [Candidatus Paceibacterota bacterium]
MKRLRKLVLALMVALFMAGTVTTTTVRASSDEVSFVDDQGRLVVIYKQSKAVIIDGVQCQYYGPERAWRYAAWLVNDLRGNDFADKCDDINLMIDNLEAMNFWWWMM